MPEGSNKDKHRTPQKGQGSFKPDNRKQDNSSSTNPRGAGKNKLPSWMLED